MGKWQRSLYQPVLPLGKDGKRVTGSAEHIALSRKAAGEGMVLVKNENDTLPLAKGTKVALFGKGTIDYVKGGGGSGDVTVEYIRNFYEGMKIKEAEGEVSLFHELPEFYEKNVKEQYAAGAVPGMTREPEVPDELVQKAKAYTDTAIITICRFSGEGWDRKCHGVEGCAHSIFEIVSNSIDEARDGHGDTINVTRCKDGSVIVEDFGRGMPVDWNNGEGRYNWELLFCEMYAGGKYGEGEDNYEFSLGLNGLGLCATQYSSAWMTADIYRDGYHYHLDFKKGENVGGLQKEPYKGRRTGSIIHWKPDDEVFTDIDVPGSYYKDVLRRQAVVNAGLTLNFTDEKEKDPATGKAWKESWCYEHGIADYVAETAGEDTLTPVFSCESEATGRDREDQPEYKVKMSAAFCFSNKVQLLEYYHNSSWLEHGGSPEHAVRTAFVYQINKYLKDKNLYKKGESAISFQDVQDCLVYVSSSFSTRTSYENQTKKAITNKFVSQAMTDFLKHYLEVYFLEKPEEAQKICQQVLVNKQSREHAEKTRQSIKKTLSTQIDLANRVQKFVDCRTKDASRRELYIVEGDSAMGAVKQSRDSEYQAIMPIRGKILNCLKADYARIFKSDIIVDLIKVMGCGVELGGKHNKELATFNLDNLRYNKIVICTDADVDGYQIRTLVLTMLYRLTPTLINEGYVYIAESPLYEITTKDRTYFAYTEPEKAAFLKEIGEKKYTIQRSKGLGENDPEMMWLTTMNPESRRLIKVLPTDVEETARVFDLLLGDNLAGRKEHIAEHGAEYLDDLDVS